MPKKKTEKRKKKKVRVEVEGKSLKLWGKFHYYFATIFRVVNGVEAMLKGKSLRNLTLDNLYKFIKLSAKTTAIIK